MILFRVVAHKERAVPFVDTSVREVSVRMLRVVTEWNLRSRSA